MINLRSITTIIITQSSTTLKHHFIICIDLCYCWNWLNWNICIWSSKEKSCVCCWLLNVAPPLATLFACKLICVYNSWWYWCTLMLYQDFSSMQCLQDCKEMLKVGSWKEGFHNSVSTYDVSWLKEMKEVSEEMTSSSPLDIMMMMITNDNDHLTIIASWWWCQAQCNVVITDKRAQLTDWVTAYILRLHWQ